MSVDWIAVDPIRQEYVWLGPILSWSNECPSFLSFLSSSAMFESGVYFVNDADARYGDIIKTHDKFEENDVEYLRDLKDTLRSVAENINVGGDE